MDKYKVRLIEEKDDPAVEALIRSCLLEYGGDRPGTAWYDEGLPHFSRIYSAEGSAYWVCEDESGRIVGGCGIGGFPEAEGVCELQKLYCAKEVRGRGIAQLLMDKALAFAREHYREIFLDTLANMTAAQRFYRKYGFSVSTVHPAETGHFGCEVLMRRLLAPPDLSRFKGAVFDLDGTLIDSAHVWTDIDIRFLSKRGLTVPEDYTKIISTMNFFDAAVYTKERFSLDDTPEAMIDEWFSYALEEYRDRIKPRPHAAEFLRMLKSRGVKLALATASDKRLYTAVLQSNGMLELFDVFASTDEVMHGKGYPDVYLLAADRLGLSPDECIVFEDIIEGVRGAKAGGFTAAACLNGVFPDDEAAMRCESDLAFSDFSELMP